ncbi:MAG: hypothetical protein HY337_06705 [Gemmatimonadetes bacterium]|nr:hypothetical protein [Gemmatimonadota bacterium]
MTHLGPPVSRGALAALTLLCAAGLRAQQPAAPAQQPEAAALKALEWRSIGPANMGGRVSAIAGVPGNRDTFYVGGADGGVFKTTNGGTTFEAQFTDQAVYSVGALTVAPSDHNVLWLGSGEGDPRNSASFGNGVYRSTDGGKSWTHLGLDNTERIKRIEVDPRDPDVAYVCALGHAWGGNDERGVFRTTDGGKTWQKVLFVDRDTGCSDIAMDAANPRVLYAGMWTFRRRPWRFDDSGEKTALHRTTDGGATWTKLTNGLPKGPMARIGVATSRSHPATAYLVTETKTEGVLFRSDDRGESWRKVHDDPNINFRPFYYSDIRVDPNDPNTVWSLSGGLYKSTDGGATFRSVGRGVHGDHQAMWIDPMNSDRVLSGSDGGYQVSYDGGTNWEVINNVVLSQFYHVFYDMRAPYYVCGGLQDNGNWCGPSAVPYSEGIRKDDWFTVSGGDGFYAVPIPTEPHLVYSNSQGGNIVLTDTRTGASRSLHPYPNRVGSAGDGIAEHKYRYNWDSPIHLSPHAPGTVYFGGNVLFKSTNYGQSWEAISPDLTTNDKSKQQSSGGAIYVDNTAAEFHSTILTIAESPVRAGVIWVGTDDGNIQVTQDGGRTWANVVGNIRGLPLASWVARIEASPHDAGTAYVAVDRHRDDDFTPHVFKTADYGRTWTSLRGNLPLMGYAQVVREDPVVRNLLFVGTELGIFASWDGGQRWASLRNNLPPVSVRDIKVHPRDHDLIVGTHGRGVFILDDITALRQVAQAMQADAYLFDVRPATRWMVWGRDASLGAKTFAAENPPYGALITYYVKTDPKDPVVITISERGGRPIRELRRTDVKAGVNRLAWDLRYDGPRPAQSQGQQAGGGGGGGGFGGAGVTVVPGEYTVTLRAAGRDLTKSVRVAADPRVQVAQADYEAQLAAALELRDLVSQVNQVIDRTEDLKKQLTGLIENLGKTTMAAADGGNGSNGSSRADTALVAATRAALQRVTDLRAKLTRPIQGLGYRQYPRLREELTSLMGAGARPLARPTDAQMLRLGELKTETAQVVSEANAIVTDVIPELNRRLGEAPHIVPGAAVR